jgi:predicted flap endonuclease-1-like 5' DNA nuclease
MGKSDKMSAARTIFGIGALTFALLVGITLIFPSLPPAQLLRPFLGITQTTFVWGISTSILINGVINGCYWAIIAIMVYGVAKLVIQPRKVRSLWEMPAAPHLTTAPPENPLVNSRDLLKVKGVGRKYSKLLGSAGVTSITDLSTKNPRYLQHALKAVNKERSLVRRTPLSKTIETWVNDAKNLKQDSTE